VYQPSVVVGTPYSGLFPAQGGYVVAETAEKALEIAKEKTGNASLTMADLRQDEDVSGYLVLFLVMADLSV